MIKKIFGLLAAAAILALLVVTVLHRDRYRSWCFAPAAETVPAAPAEVAPPAAVAPVSEEAPFAGQRPDSLLPAATAEPADSLPSDAAQEKTE